MLDRLHDRMTDGTAKGLFRCSPGILREREWVVLRQIAGGVPLRHALEEMLRAIEAENDSTVLLSVLFLSPDGQHLRHGTGPHLPAAYNRAIDGIRAGLGPAVIATAPDQPIRTADIATDSLWRDVRQPALQHGLRTCWSIPVKAPTGEILGTVAAYLDRPLQPSAADIATMSFIAQTVALVIGRHRSDLAIKLSDRALRRLEADLEGQVTARAQERSRTWQLSPDLLGVLNPDGYFEASNPAWQTSLGWSEDEIRAKRFAEFLHPADLFNGEAAFETVKQGIPVFQFESRYRARNGGFRWLSWTAVPETGKFYWSARDITREKQQADQLHARTRERDRAWQLSRELLVVASPEGKLEAVNPTWTELLDWEAKDLIGANFNDFIHPQDLKPTQRAFTRIFRAPVIVPYEFRLRHKDGSYRWFAWTGTFENGKVYASGRDVTNERKREAILRDTQDFTRLAFSTVGGVGVWTCDVASDRFFYDDVIADLYGIDPAQGATGILRAEFLRNVHPDDRAALTAKIEGSPSKPGDLEGEYRLLHPDGKVRWVMSRGHIYRDPSGTAVRHTGVGVETTNQREMEQALRQSQKMEAVGQLTGGVAHDFNNFLTVIRSSADLLMRPNIPEERRGRYIAAISDTVDRAARLTGQLLAFARRQALKPETFSVGDGVQAIGEMLRTLTGARIDIITHLPPQACWVNADPSQFDTALVNMVVNARDAMNGEGRLTISVAMVDRMPPRRSQRAIEKPFVCVSITDTGIGIPEEQLEKIFEPFFTTKGIGHGTGLGLSQVFGFAKQSGGDVAVASEVGKGTTFTLYLPSVSQVDDVASETVEPDLTTDGHGTRVLVVEDNSDVGNFTMHALTELGYVTVLATNAEEALAELADNSDRFDVVFTDVVMPGMNGIELAKRIRILYFDLPVILASGYSHVLAQDGSHGFELLHKPYSIAELSTVLGKVSSWKRRRRNPGRPAAFR